ncbi:MAG: hypothetical protein KDA96_09895, partial [Planctomycetaceae bacterium]|nr:hypothetical protein [Planctomycetaceae bacterium]
GPEYTFGLYASKLLDEPILIIKTAWGGKSLNTDFRPPGAGPYQWSDVQIEKLESQKKDIAQIRTDKINATGRYYRLMIDHVRNVLSDIKRVVPDYQPARGYQLAGFVWFQGWNDMVDSGTYPNRDQPGGYDAYSDVMVHFIHDVRKDLEAPRLPFVIGVLGVGGPVAEYGPDQQRYRSVHQNFRLAMAAPADLPEFKGNVAAVWTEKYWDGELTAAQNKQNQIRQQAKKQADAEMLKPEEARALSDRMCSEGLTDREKLVLEKGISNQAFHYLGSAKILGGIGKGFAEAMVSQMHSAQ